MQININPKKILSVIAVGVFVLLVVYFGSLTFIDYSKDVQIIPWSAGENSPYICFAAIKGSNRLLALDCLDTSLTVIK